MSTKPNVVAAYGDPKKAKNWPAKRIRRASKEEIDHAVAEIIEGAAETVITVRPVIAVRLPPVGHPLVSARLRQGK